MNGAMRAGEERVTFVADESNADHFIPQVSSGGSIRDFEAEDMTRVLDFGDIPEPPADGPLMFAEDGGVEGLQFPKYYFCLRGGYLFYFDRDDVDEDSGPYAIYVAPPLGVVPLDKITVEFPPGGRRVFREHAHTDARSGYELVIVHTPDDYDTEQIRPPNFLVADSLGQREKWAQALRTRADIGKPTLMRGGYSSTSRAAFKNEPSITPAAVAAEEAAAATVPAPAATTNSSVTSGRAALQSEMRQESSRDKTSKRSLNNKKSRESKAIEKQVMDVSDDAELASAVVEFGKAHFDEKDWLDNFFQIHNDFDAPAKCSQMELWQTDMKKSLKGAVLEQYEYFVQASGEMTTMGREVASLKNLIEIQVETIKDMKEIDFAGSLFGPGKNEVEDEARATEPPRLNRRRNENGHAGDERSVFSDASSVPDISERGEKSATATSKTSLIEDTLDGDATPIEVANWLDDVSEDIAATVRECRYNDAIELLNKAKTEVSDLFEKHERPTPDRLTRKQEEELKSLQKKLDRLRQLISGRLEENLRRKNEALKQASKRERSDPNAAMAPIVSPCALNDDALYLQMLVKLGRTSEAAEAYSSRRSLLLLETLHERPISGSGTVDLVIYAAQLSQSFFTCLASSVEGFLDLFLMTQSLHGDKQEDLSLADSSLHSHTSKSIPAGAVASVVLWCDAELSKFASAFGGTRILSNLALSPPPRDAPRKPRVVGGGAGDDANGSKERNNAISVAAQCVDQAFLHATQNLDSVGLPLAPRLAEYIRIRLKGCEAEVSHLLDEKWQQLTQDWRAAENGLPIDDRRR